MHLDSATETRKRNFSSMDFSLCLSSPIISTFVHFLLVASLFCPVRSSEMRNTPDANNTFRPQEEVHKLNIIRSRLQQINKPSIKTIQVCQSFMFFTSPVFLCSVLNFPCFYALFWTSPVFYALFLDHNVVIFFPSLQSPDGDIIDCVVSHQQPAFDHPLLKGQRPLVVFW